MFKFFSLYQLSAVAIVLIVFMGGRTTNIDRVLSSSELIKSKPTNSSSPILNPIHSPSPISGIKLLDRIEIARSITVKIAAPDFIGSGTIVGVDKDVYTAITNAHVLISASPPYQIITSDRVVHRAKILKYSNLENYDLAILQFYSPASKYSVAKVGNSSHLSVGDSLFVGGFTKQSSQHSSDDFLLQSGAISIILDRGIDSGYRIGYTHQIFRGMSGGPVLDRYNTLVGINGLLNDPIWKTSSIFADNSIPCEPLQVLLDQSSLAILIDDIIKLIPRSKWLKQEEPLSIKNIPDTPQEAEKRAILQRGAKKALSCS
jgi:S1-C subfamily serine protease